MDCALCQKLQSELERLESLYAEKRELLRANVATATVADYHKFRAAEADAKRDLEVARVDLIWHQKNYHPKGIGHSGTPR